METIKTVTEKNELGNAIKWYDDSEIQINPINGYSVLYRRIFYENGYVKRIVVGFSEKERDLASSTPDMLEALIEAKRLIDVLTNGKSPLLGKPTKNLITNAINKATK